MERGLRLLRLLTYVPHSGVYFFNGWRRVALNRHQDDPQIDVENEFLLETVGITGQLDQVEGTAAVWQGEDHDDSLPTLTPEEEQVQAVAYAEEQIERYEATLLTEAVDPAWSTGAQDSLSDAFYQAAPDGVALAATECRASLCRMDFSFDDTVSPEEGSDALARFTPWSGRRFIAIPQDGFAGAIMYLAREG